MGIRNLATNTFGKAQGWWVGFSAPVGWQLDQDRIGPFTPWQSYSLRPWIIFFVPYHGDTRRRVSRNHCAVSVRIDYTRRHQEAMYRAQGSSRAYDTRFESTFDITCSHNFTKYM